MSIRAVELAVGIEYAAHVIAVFLEITYQKQWSLMALILVVTREMPKYLRNLTEVEEIMIVKSQPFGKVRKLSKL